MKYRKGYKIQLAEMEVFNTSIKPVSIVQTESGRVVLYPSGKVEVDEGYSCDAVTPIPLALTKKEWIPASALHDALYELSREGMIPHSAWELYDEAYLLQLKKDGAWGVTVSIHGWILKKMGGKYAHPRMRKKVHTAP